MNEQREVFAILELADKLNTDYQTIDKKVKKYKFNRSKKMLNGRNVKAVLLSPEEFEAIRHDLEYNKKVYTNKKVINKTSVSNEYEAENTSVIEVNSQISSMEILTNSIRKGYELAIESQKETIETQQEMINMLKAQNNELQAQIALLLSAKKVENKTSVSDKNKQLLSNIKNFIEKLKNLKTM